MADDHEHDGASVKEQLVHACRGNNVDLLREILSSYESEEEIAKLLNSTTSVLGNHLYHEAALKGNDDIIEILLDQEGFECDPINRAEGDTPLHSAVRWINGEPAAQREFGDYLVNLMLEAGSDPTVRNKAKLTALQLVDPTNTGLRDIIQRHEQLNREEEEQQAYLRQNKADFVNVQADDEEEDDDDAEFSGSDDEERAEWERRRKSRKGQS